MKIHYNYKLDHESIKLLGPILEKLKFFQFVESSFEFQS